MSAAVRQAIAAAASTVAGITCTPTYVQLTQRGQATVQRVALHTDRFGLLGGEWNVVICLGTDMAAAEDYFDEKVPAVLAALADVLDVNDKRHPINNLTLVDGTSVLAAFINGFREE